MIGSGIRRASLALILVAAAGCQLLGPSGDAPRDQLEEARARWAAVGPRRYRVVEDRICFCGNEGPVVITVRPPIVTRVYQSDGRAVASDLERFYPTVEELFDEIDAALDRGDHLVEARYDPVTGAPLEVYLDRDERMIDEEVRWVLGVPEAILD